VHTTAKRSGACEKKQPQGRIVDFLKKQAQQPPPSKGSGFRPLDASLSGNTRKSKDSSKSSTLYDSFPAVLGNRNHPDYTETVDSTCQLHNVPRNADSSFTSAIHTKTVLPASSSNTRTVPRFSVSGATQSSSASMSGSLFQSAQELSTQASIGRSLLEPCIVDEASEHCPGMLSRPAIPPLHQALPTSGSPYRRPYVSNSLIINLCPG
jgi:hypothetical protein